MNRIKQWIAIWHLKKFLKSNKTGWVITQRGNEYSIEPIKRNELGGYDTIGTDEVVEDNAGLMHNLMGVPLGLRVDDQRPIVDVLSAQVAKRWHTSFLMVVRSNRVSSSALSSCKTC